MHMVSKRDLGSAELETMRTSRSPTTTVLTANGEVQTRDEATVYVNELDFFVTVMLLEETLASTEEPLHSSSGKMRGKHKIKIRDASLDSQPEIQSSSVEETLQRIMGADQQRLQISDLHFDKFPTPATFACWKIRFKTEVCTCSQFPTKAMQWITEVQLVDSEDDLKSSLSVRGIRMPNFEVLDAKIASALNKIIHNSHFKRRISLEEQKAQKQNRFLRGRQIACLIYEYFRVTGANDSVENYADLFTIVLRNDDIQEFDSKWDEILLSLTKIPPDDILEGLYKLRIRESHQLKTVLEVRHGNSSEGIDARLSK